MVSPVEWLEKATGLTPEVQAKVFASIAVLIVLWILRKAILAWRFRGLEDIRARYRWKKSSAYVGVGLGILLLARIWLAGFGALATYLGLVSAGVAIALKDLLTNLAAWIFIIWRRPFEVGDRIEIGEHRGDVIDLRIFQFTLMEIGNWVDAEQSTGRVIHIPNGKIFSEAQANYSKGFQYVWNEIPVLVTFESDWKKAKQILLRIANEHAEHLSAEAQERVREAAKKFLIFFTALTPTVYTSVRESGVLLTMRYLCEPRRRRGSEQSIWEDILDEFREHEDIDFAYPTQRFYNNLAEGKRGTKPVATDGGSETSAGGDNASR
jgi:small-conductance mechanosensitive channel